MDYEIGPDESVSTAVICGVSAVEGCDPCSLRSLTEILDPDALDALFDTRANGSPRAGGRISFVYDRCRVTVENGDYLTIELLETSHQVGHD